MDFTGERYVPTMEGPLKYEHVHRYVLASAFAGGRTVLDLACGEGYGAAILASTGQVVVGVDADAEIVAHAADTYEADNLHFLVGACEAVPIADATFDLVTSFETIEHHDRHDEMLGEIKRLLKPGGVLIISSPSKVSYSDESGYVNPYHVRELYYEEFRRLLKKHFRNLRFFGQKFGSGS
ncbi:MAG TPA: class I SAM-dependent methyltransferase, partial [Terriglobia bacterium]|nr:class I SAM-dependent methyltransferase [Terriglobia bacterium]